jgi:DNA repair protein RadA/Sms
MDDDGLSEVHDPSQLFLGERAAAAGSAVTATLHGARPMLVEVQALVSSAGYGTPRRLVSGLDYNRACMIIAVLERRCGMRLGDQDVYVSVAGGLRVVDPAADLGMALAIASAFRNRPVRDELACFGEIGLAGEVRAVTGAARRANEAVKLGFRRPVVPAASSAALSSSGCSFVAVRTVTEAIAAAFD